MYSDGTKLPAVTAADTAAAAADADAFASVVAVTAAVFIVISAVTAAYTAAFTALDDDAEYILPSQISSPIIEKKLKNRGTTLACSDTPSLLWISCHHPSAAY